MKKTKNKILNIELFLAIILIIIIIFFMSPLINIQWNGFNSENSKETNYINSSIVFISKELSNTLNKKYNNKTEFFACLNFDIKNSYKGNRVDSIFIADSYTDYVEGGDNFVRIKSCKQASIHSHPNGECKMSWLDKESFKKTIKDGEIMKFLMCDNNKFVYISDNDFNERWVTVI